MGTKLDEGLSGLQAVINEVLVRHQVLARAVYALSARLPAASAEAYCADLRQRVGELSEDVADLAGEQIDAAISGELAALLDAAGQPPERADD